MLRYEKFVSLFPEMKNVFPGKRNFVDRDAIAHQYDVCYYIKRLFQSEENSVEKNTVIQIWREHIQQTEHRHEFETADEETIEVFLLITMFLHDVSEEKEKLSVKVENKIMRHILVKMVIGILSSQPKPILDCINALTEYKSGPFSETEYILLQLLIKNKHKDLLADLKLNVQHWFITKAAVLEKLARSSKLVVFLKSLDLLANLQDTQTEVLEAKRESKGGTLYVLNKYKAGAILKFQHHQALAETIRQVWPDNPILVQVDSIILDLCMSLKEELEPEKILLLNNNPFMQRVSLQPNSKPLVAA